MRDRLFLLLGSALLAFAVCGCGAKIVKVHGKILKNGNPLVVSSDTYVTLSFVPDEKDVADKERTSHNAKFDQGSGTYSVNLPAGKYKTMLIVVPPGQKSGGGGKLSAPPRPIYSPTAYELTKNQELDITMPPQ